MTHDIDIDTLYDSFCRSVPAALEGTARTLAFKLKLVPNHDIPWSAVFKHAVTLGAPALFAEAMPGVDARTVERAVFAHMLAVIEAFGTDRIADQQIPDEPALRQVLELTRSARDEALSSIGGEGTSAIARQADRQTVEAIATERRLLFGGEPVSLETYERISAGKQAVGLPGTVVLAEAAGWGETQLEAVRSTLMGVWLGLQFQDDVIDWEDDITRGGAWAVLLALRSNGGAPAPVELEGLRRLVLSSGTLADMLRLALGKFQVARAGAEWLGAGQLAEWLRAREVEALDYCAEENRSPGYVLRLKKLSLWALEVLS
jgi:hypothetical protein